MKLQKQLLLAIFALFIVAVIGMIGFSLLQSDYSLLDSIYMTIITIFSVGYREIHPPLSPITTVFTIILITIGVSTFALTTAILTAFILEGSIGQRFRRQKMQKEINNMKNHFIVCGAGTTAEFVVDEFRKMEHDFVVIDIVEDKIEELKAEVGEFPYVVGDATQDSILLKAGVKNAAGLVSVLPEDKDNLFVVISARELNEKLRIVARALEEETTKKLYKVGANSVVSPTAIGGMRIASVMLRPNVVSFLDQMLKEKEMTLRVEEATIEPGSVFIEKTIAETDIGRKTGAIIVAIKEGATAKHHFNPPSTTKLKANDVLILIGSVEQVHKLKELGSKSGLSVNEPGKTS